MENGLENEIFKEFFALALRRGDVCSKNVGESDSPCYICGDKILSNARHANLPGDENTWVALYYKCFKEIMSGEWDRYI